jgi:hypothetical protein
MGDRTKEALEQFADSLVPSAGMPHAHHGQLVVGLLARPRVLSHTCLACHVLCAAKQSPALSTKHQQTSTKLHTAQAAPTVHGCNMAGFVLVKKVPGTMHFTARADGHSFDHALMNMTHVVHQLYFGSRPSSRKL